MSVPASAKTVGAMEVVGQARAMTDDNCVTNKRRRLDSGDPLLIPKPSLSNDPLPNQCHLSVFDSPKISVSPTTTLEFPDQILPTSLCLKNQSMTYCSRSADLKADENSGTDEISISIGDGFSSDEKTEEEMESLTTKKRKISQATSVDAAKMPSTEEIQEFFTVTEKFEKKRFLEKYNYDIVKDVPLEGRYQWVCLNP